MADIQESSVPRLPRELGNTENCKLEGYLNLQVSKVKLQTGGINISSL